MLLACDEVIEGVLGGKLEFEIGLVDEHGAAIDTTDYDQFKICIKIDSANTLEVSETPNGNGSLIAKQGSPEKGVFNVLINPPDTLTLKAKERQNIDFEMSEAADANNVRREVFKDRLTMHATSCPNP